MALWGLLGSQKTGIQDDRRLLRPKKCFVKLVCFSVCLISILQACSAGPPIKLDDEVKKGQPRSKLFSQNQKVFAERNPTIVSSIGALEVTTRIATMAEIPDRFYKGWGTIIAIGAGGLALGLVASPMFASALVVGGAILIPGGIYGYFSEKGIWDSINEALNNAELTRAIDSAMKARINTAFAEECAPNVKIEMIIQAFGIDGSSFRERNCFVISADFILSRDSKEVIRDQLRITRANKSTDAPSPQCARLEDFAKNEARLIKDKLGEYADALAVMATDRILRENSK